MRFDKQNGHEFETNKRGQIGKRKRERVSERERENKPRQNERNTKKEIKMEIKGYEIFEEKEIKTSRVTKI